MSLDKWGELYGVQVDSTKMGTMSMRQDTQDLDKSSGSVTRARSLKRKDISIEFAS